MYYLEILGEVNPKASGIHAVPVSVESGPKGVSTAQPSWEDCESPTLRPAAEYRAIDSPVDNRYILLPQRPRW